MLGWGWPIFPNLVKRRSPPPKLSTVEKNDSQHRRQGHERGKEREISLFTLTFSLHAVRSYSTEKRDFPFPYYGHQIPRSEQYSFLQDLGNTAPNEENLKVTVILFGRMASVVTEHNFTAQISPVWLTLAFSLVEMRINSIYFYFRSDANWFSSRCFQAKIKIGLLRDPAPTNRVQLSY